MSAATATPASAVPTESGGSAARLIVTVVLVAVVLLGVSLLAVSVLAPSATLAARLFGAVGEARSGALAQELSVNLDARLRVMGSLFLLLAAGLVATRQAFQNLVGACLADLRLPLTWPSSATLLLAGLPALVAIGVRVPFLSQPMRYDEALTFNEFASRPLYYGLSYYPDPNNHLLNTLLMHLAVGALGNEPWVLRLPAFLAGVLVVPATFALARQLFEPRAAVFAASLVAVSSCLVEYSTNARGYALQALSFVVVLCLVIFAARRGSLSALFLAVFMAALGAFAVPTMLYGVAIAAVWLIFELRTSETRAGRIRPAHLVASGLVLGLAGALGYLLVAIVSGPDKLVLNRFVLPLDLGELAMQLPRSLWQTFELWNRDIPLPLAALLVVGFAVGTPRAPLGLVSVGVCLVFVLLQRVAPFERVWLFLLPLYFTIASGGLSRFVDGRLLALAFGAAVGFVTLTSGSILRSTETGVFPDAEPVARALAARLAAQDAVLTTVPTSLPELQYYFPRFGLPIDTLVRSPAEASHVWVVTPPGVAPAVDGFGPATPIAHFADSDLSELTR